MLVHLDLAVYACYRSQLTRPGDDQLIHPPIATYPQHEQRRCRQAPHNRPRESQLAESHASVLPRCLAARATCNPIQKEESASEKGENTIQRVASRMGVHVDCS